MAKDWVRVTLGNLAEIKHGFPFQGEFFRDQPPGDILLTPGNFMIGGGFKSDKFKYYVGDVPEIFVLKEGELLVTMTDLSKTGDTLGYPALIPKPPAHHRFLHNQRLGKVIILSNSHLCLNFLYYLMQTKSYRNEILASATGTTVKHTSPDRIKAFKFLLPPLGEQKAIAHILSTLDDKIALNQKMNRTLEEMAKAIFKSWFVDFDPVKAKMEGKQPVGMDAETAALFPHEFEESALGAIPKGWKVFTICDVCEFAYGKSLTQNKRRSGKVPVYGSNGQIGWHDEPLVKGPGIVVGRKGNPGIVTWVSKDFYPIDTTFYVVLKHEVKSFHYLFHTLLRMDLASLSADSAVPGLNRNLAYMSKILVAESKLLTAFDFYVSKFTAKINQNLDEVLTLTTIRDSLLPKLMSGLLRVKEAEKML